MKWSLPKLSDKFIESVLPGLDWMVVFIYILSGNYIAIAVLSSTKLFEMENHFFLIMFILIEYNSCKMYCQKYHMHSCIDKGQKFVCERYQNWGNYFDQ